MTARSPVFSAKLSRLLCTIRLKAGLTQDEVAHRLGLKGATRANFVSRLELGKTPGVTFETVVRFLHACGARLSALSDLTDELPPLPRDERLEQIVNDYRQEARPEAIVGKFADRDRVSDIVLKATADAFKAERHAAYPNRGAPPRANDLRIQTLKLREYRVQLGLISSEVKDYLLTQKVSAHEFIWYTRLCAGLLSVLRNSTRTKRKRISEAERLNMVEAKFVRLGLQPEIVAQTRQLVEKRWQKSFLPKGK